jgi:hypothetical protein
MRATHSRGDAVTVRFIVGAALLALSGAPAAEDVPPPPPMPEESARPSEQRPATAPRECRDCGAVRSIRALERERPTTREVPTYMTSDQYLNNREYSEPMVGPVFGMSFGKGQETKSFVGAAGNETMRRRILEIYYEVTVRFDDGRFGLFEQEDARGLRAGDRVMVVDNKVLPATK